MGAWIEIDYLNHPTVVIHVAPLVGAWIEISLSVFSNPGTNVAPLVGAWIEIPKFAIKKPATKVAPLVGAWIEIRSLGQKELYVDLSLLSWERGLKYNRRMRSGCRHSRSSRGSVD